MPLLWSHAEFLKLLIARERRRPLELLQVVEERYGGAVRRRAAAWHWRDEVPVTRLEKGLALLIEDREPFTLHFGFDGWRHIQDREALPEPFGMWAVRLSAEELSPYLQLDFTRCHLGRWEGIDHCILMDQAPIAHRL
jgi:glucoamylase